MYWTSCCPSRSLWPAFRYGWSQTALTGRQLWENRYGQVEGLTNRNKWKVLTASRCIHTGKACHTSSVTTLKVMCICISYTDTISMYCTGTVNSMAVRKWVTNFCLENTFGLHSGCSEYFGQTAEDGKEKCKRKVIADFPKCQV